MLREQLLLRGAAHFVTPLSCIPTPLRKKDVVPGMRFPTCNPMTFTINGKSSIVFIDETNSAMFPLYALTREVKDINGNTHCSKGELDKEKDFSLLDEKSTIVIDWVKEHRCYNKFGEVYSSHTFGYHLE
jgi:hypothetical protein